MFRWLALIFGSCLLITVTLFSQHYPTSRLASDSVLITYVHEEETRQARINLTGQVIHRDKAIQIKKSDPTSRNTDHAPNGELAFIIVYDSYPSHYDLRLFDTFDETIPRIDVFTLPLNFSYSNLRMWSGNSRYFAFVVIDSSTRDEITYLYMYDVQTNTTSLLHRVVNKSLLMDFFALNRHWQDNFSPSNEWFAYTITADDANYDLYVVPSDASASPRQLAANIPRIQSLSWLNSRQASFEALPLVIGGLLSLIFTGMVIGKGGRL